MIFDEVHNHRLSIAEFSIQDFCFLKLFLFCFCGEGGGGGEVAALSADKQKH